MNAEQIMKIFADTAYIRTGGSPEELRTAQYLQDKIAGLGLKAEIVPFDVPMSRIQEAVLQVDGVEVTCKGYLCAGNGEVEAPFYYLRDSSPYALSKCRGKIVMIDGYLGYWVYHDLLENGAVGFVTYDGNTNYADRDIDQRELRSYVHNGNRIPGVNINANVICSLGVLIVGFAMLIKGADLFVEGASKIAAKFKIPQIVIGLTIVAMGTSAPEAAISISAAFQDAAAISIGNVVGSNIMNILLILGVSAVITNLKIKPNTLKFEIPFVVIITAVLLLLGWIGGGLDKIDGVIMLVLFAAFLGYLFYLYKKGDDSSADEVPQLTEKDKIPVLIFITLIGLVSIVLGSDLTVASAKSIAQVIGVDDRTISLTVVAFGTSLPELITCIAASLKKKSDIAIGNIIGSNIFNILFVVGLASICSPSVLTFGEAFIIDTIVAIATAVLLGLLVLRKKELTRAGGIIMLVAYAGYFAYLFINPLGLA